MLGLLSTAASAGVIHRRQMSIRWLKAEDYIYVYNHLFNPKIARKRTIAEAECSTEINKTQKRINKNVYKNC
jgi:hypothetical protein